MHSGNLVFICPHWHQQGNVGVIRAQRMVRWLHDSNFHVIVMCAGSADRTERTEFGQVITVKDPLGIYTDSPGVHNRHTEARKPNALRRLLSYLIFSPDLQIAWAYSCRFNALVRQTCDSADVILSSSPPESAHVLAGWMAGISKKPFVMDMRDGWLDEPMKPLLRSSSLQRFREARLERRLINQASRIVVTSSVWSHMLSRRYPEAHSKISVITNAYALNSQKREPEQNLISGTHAETDKTGRPPHAILHILHAGRIQSSRPERKVEYMLAPLLKVAETGNISGKITFLGALTDEEEAQISQWSARFKTFSWEVVRIDQVPHDQSRKLIAEADVLLMLSPSEASIPAKFFDYVSVGKPFLCFSTATSAVSTAAAEIPQCYRIDLENTDINGLTTFLDQCSKDEVLAEIPDRYKDSFTKKLFMDLLDEVIKK